VQPTSLVYEPHTSLVQLVASLAPLRGSYTCRYEARTQIRATYEPHTSLVSRTSLVYELMARIRAVYEARSAAVCAARSRALSASMPRMASLSVSVVHSPSTTLLRPPCLPMSSVTSSRNCSQHHALALHNPPRPAHHVRASPARQSIRWSQPPTRTLVPSCRPPALMPPTRSPSGAHAGQLKSTRASANHQMESRTAVATNGIGAPLGCCAAGACASMAGMT